MPSKVRDLTDAEKVALRAFRKAHNDAIMEAGSLAIRQADAISKAKQAESILQSFLASLHDSEFHTDGEAIYASESTY